MGAIDRSGLTPEEFGRALAEAADPELARVAFSRVGDDAGAREQLGRPEILPVAVRLLGFSSAAADFLVRHPEEARQLADVGRRTRAQIDEELALEVTQRGIEAALRIFRRRALMRVSARDLAGGALLEEIVGEISDVADACLAAVASQLGADGSFAVIALGKLGGAELNYSSDVDLLFVHADDREPPGLDRFISLLSEPTDEGIALRVDTALRPGGRSGALSRSVAATLAYYGDGGDAATWERQAMIKARFAVGDEAIGRSLIEGLVPLVYEQPMGDSAIDDVRRTKVRLEEYIRARGKEAWEIKRGRGGIRDVEFAVQLLQLVHGGRDANLRLTNTLDALEALADGGYVARDDADTLAGAYRFLRTIEHRLMVERDLQTHELPAGTVAQTRLARSLGLDGSKELLDRYGARTAQVRSVHERLFYRPLLEAFAGARVPAGLEREPTEELLRGLGFARPSEAFGTLAGVVDPSLRPGRVFGTLFPVIGPALSLAGDPDAALVRLARIVEAMGESDDLADRLAANPAVAARLAGLAASSRFATDLVVARPERIEQLEAEAFALGDDRAGGLVSVVGRAAAGELDGRGVGHALAQIADRVVEDALVVTAEEDDPPFAVIGLGKLGGSELQFASDLDLVFVYDGEGADPFAAASRRADGVMAAIREAGWEPDADLRPEGRSGPLARSIAGYLEYWQRWAEPWEFQSLLRARFVAGDEALGRRFVSLAADLAYPEALPDAAAAEMLRMRRRIETERAAPGQDGRFNFKLGYGSLADVQFAVELALMRSGAAHPNVRHPSTLDALDALAAAHLVEESTAHALGEAFVFLTDVKNAMEVDRRISADALPADPEEQAAIGCRLGFEEYPRATLLETYRRVTERARRAMERVFAGLADDRTER